MRAIVLRLSPYDARRVRGALIETAMRDAGIEANPKAPPADLVLAAKRKHALRRATSRITEQLEASQ